MEKEVKNKKRNTAGKHAKWPQKEEKIKTSKKETKKEKNISKEETIEEKNIDKEKIVEENTSNGEIIKEETIEEDNNEKDLYSKENKQIMKITENNDLLQEIGNAIKKQKETPKELQEKINKKIFINIFMGAVIMVYLIFINIGSINIKPKNFIVDLQVFSISLIVATIIIWEKAYKKDSGILTIHGIEILALSIFTMILPEIYIKYNNVFEIVVSISSLVFAIYYIGKSIIIYLKMKKNIRKSDVKKIARKSK